MRDDVRPDVDHHFDGKRFFNPGAARAKRNLGQVAKWQLKNERQPWPQRLVSEQFPLPSGPIVAGQVSVSFINHSSFLIRFPGVTLLTDPIFSERCSPVSWAGPKRVRDPGLALEDLPRTDIVLLSHNHYDHMDFPSLRAIKERFAPRFVTLLGNGRYLAKLGIMAQELAWWDGLSIGETQIIATPARHFSARSLFDRNRALWGGFMIRAGGGQILFAGDTGWGRHFEDVHQRLGAPDVALLPIGAYEPRWFMAPVHINPEEAVAAHIALKAKQSIGMHFGTFQLTDEAIDAPLTALAEARAEAGLGEQAFITLGFGETRAFPCG